MSVATTSTTKEMQDQGKAVNIRGDWAASEQSWTYEWCVPWFRRVFQKSTSTSGEGRYLTLAYQGRHGVKAAKRGRCNHSRTICRTSRRHISILLRDPCFGRVAEVTWHSCVETQHILGGCSLLHRVTHAECSS